ncbi:MAG TPA: hypothetical protein VK934_13305 [Fimbriimonas sp.]|nr:hypothetical protein [Fimbriimonas sp.]
MNHPPLYRQLLELARAAQPLLDSGETRPRLLTELRLLFADVDGLLLTIAGEVELNAVRELAGAGLMAAEFVGSTVDQKLFLEVIVRLAPLSSPQYAWAEKRFDELTRLV